MKRLLVLLFSIFLVSCTSSLKTPVRQSADLIKHMGGSTVALVINENGYTHVYCSGVWISETHILTAGHCMAGLARHIKGKDEGEVDPVGVKVHYIIEREVTDVGEEPTAIHLAKVEKWNEDKDLALVKAFGKTIPYHNHAELVKEMPALGESVFIVGHPKGLYWSYINGVVSSYRSELSFGPLSNYGPFVQISAPVWFGNSGGGAFDGNGDLVGIASFITRAPNTSFFVHPDNIKNFLKE